MFKRRFFEECFNNFVPTKKVSEVQNNTETHWQEQYLLLCSGEQSHKGLNVIMVSIWWQNWHFWVKRWNWQFFKKCQSPSLLCFTNLASEIHACMFCSKLAIFNFAPPKCCIICLQSLNIWAPPSLPRLHWLCVLYSYRGANARRPY